MLQKSDEEGCVAEMTQETIEAIQQIISINVIVTAVEANQAALNAKKTATTPSNRLTKNKIYVFVGSVYMPVVVLEEYLILLPISEYRMLSSMSDRPF